MLTRLRSLKVKLETARGTAVVPDTDVFAFDIECNPDESMAERKGSGAFMGQTAAAVPENSGAWTLSFKTELRGSSDWDAGLSILMQSSGSLLSTKTMNPTSASANFKTMSAYVYEDGRVKKIKGSCGTGVLAPDDGRLVWSFTYKGVEDTGTPVADLALPTTAYAVTIPIPWGQGTNTATLAAADLAISTFTFDMGNEVSPVYDQGAIAYYQITDRSPTIAFDPDAALVATRADDAIWKLGTESAVDIAMTDGTTSFTLNAPKWQRTEIPTGDRDGTIIQDMTGQCNVETIATGDDEWTIVAA